MTFKDLSVPAIHERFSFREALSYFLIFTALFLTTSLIEFFHPVSYVYFISEDKIGEYATSVAFAAAACFFVAVARRGIGLNRLFMFSMAFLSLLIAGEEISWGQRIFGVDTPELLRNVNHQGEITLHNIGPLQEANFHEVAGVLLQILMVTSALKNRLSQSFASIRSLSLPPVSLWPSAVVVSYVLVAMPMVKGDEIAEAFLAFLVLTWSILIFRELRAEVVSERDRVVAVACVLAATIATGAVLSTVFGKNMGWRYNITASRDYPNFGMMEQSRILFEHILNRPDLIQPDTLENYSKIHGQLAAD
ncbi:MAG TPA: hypothetical protein VLO13_04475 [Halomonas sp.]|nr:hypothetical protein [Halomonas sp.]